MRTSPPPNHSYRCPNGCDTYIDAASANRTLVRQMTQEVMSHEAAAELQGPVESQLAEHVRQEMPGVKPPAVSVECIIRYATDPETYLDGDAETAAELMNIIVERIDADDHNAVITYRSTSLLDPPAAGPRRQAVNLQPNSLMGPDAPCRIFDAKRQPHTGEITWRTTSEASAAVSKAMVARYSAMPRAPSAATTAVAVATTEEISPLRIFGVRGGH